MPDPWIDRLDAVLTAVPRVLPGARANVVGLLLDEGTDWQKLAEVLTDSYCIQAPGGLAAQVERGPGVAPASR